MANYHRKTVSGIIFGIQILVLTLEIQQTVSQCNECPDGWLRFKNSCYFLTDVKPLNFSDALNYCTGQDTNAHLVALETFDEMDFIKGFLRRLFEDENNYWLGATDSQTEGTWVWAHSGAQVAETDWAPGQPNDWHHLEDCAAFDGSEDCMWRDFVCYGLHRPLCELEFSSSISVVG